MGTCSVTFPPNKIFSFFNSKLSFLDWRRHGEIVSHVTRSPLRHGRVTARRVLLRYELSSGEKLRTLTFHSFRAIHSGDFCNL